MAQKPEKVASPEGNPRLRAVKVQANTIGEAMGKAGGTPAGQADLDWVRDPANFAKAKKMLKGGTYYFFPAAADGEDVPFVDEFGGGFWQFSFHRDDRWGSDDRVVLRD